MPPLNPDASTSPSDKLRSDALEIWQAGIEAVKPARLFESKLVWEPDAFCIDDVWVDLSKLKRIVVVGAGKASGAMAAAFYQQLQQHFSQQDKSAPPCVGWVNCPAETFDPNWDTGQIHLHTARPAGMNVPTPAAVEGTRQILDIVRSCTAEDLLLCLLSGGGSAVLVAPPPGLELADKQAVAQRVAAAGGNIDQLNLIRRCLSLVKGGGLAAQFHGQRLITLAISDCLGDPIETIASGPTVAGSEREPRQALAALEDLQLLEDPALQRIVQYLQALVAEQNASPPLDSPRQDSREYIVLGNNSDAVDAAGVKAVELGYRYVMQAARAVEGDVSQVACHAAQAATQVMQQEEVDCWISGGEPTVTLPQQPGKGGRNQQLTLAVLDGLVKADWPNPALYPRPLVFLSGGTDGEDGPTDAAGAMFDAPLWQAAERAGVRPEDYLSRADAYHYFARVGGLIRTGATGTNVCDLRVALAGPRPTNAPDR
ncbi:glycerate kinase type-2 family protein [Aureliella helgolandensis]|uniref:Hydroxypyruvate reductase n=1 Tax=Aureliella helgolandensis TaxID=2527968 RepID=A0A518GEB8_9BACT|nr:DUF4147 domain-containing protein [Aureliella helgolandensis]QDV26897.1 Putative hydroxypyruvate reductase [Aureliella helgolandensis]